MKRHIKSAIVSLALGSNSCSASAGSSATIPNSFGSHYCLQFSIGFGAGTDS